MYFLKRFLKEILPLHIQGVKKAWKRRSLDSLIKIYCNR